MKLLKNKILNLLVVLSLTGFPIAKADNNVLYLEKDQKAPYSGLLFTESYASRLRSELLESDKTKLRLESELYKNQGYLGIIQLKESEIELYKSQNQRLIQQEHTSENMRYIWFGLGVLATGFAVYSARGLSK